MNSMPNGFVSPQDTAVPGGTTDGGTFGVRLFETAPNVWIANIASIGMISGSLLPPYIDNFTLDVSPATETGPVPEPSTFFLSIAGFAGLVLATARPHGPRS